MRNPVCAVILIFLYTFQKKEEPKNFSEYFIYEWQKKTDVERKGGER